MKTPTHMLIGYAFSRLMPGSGPGKAHWIIAGAAAPDIPLIGFCLGCGAYLLMTGTGEASAVGFVNLVDRFYFDSSVFIALHHLLHSPVSLTLLCAGWLALGRLRSGVNWRGLWFLGGAASHSVVDLVTHSRDGLLVFWPFDWSFRFNAGIDQWDMEGSGQAVLIVEISFFVVWCLAAAWSRLHPFYQFLTWSPINRPAFAGA